MVGSWFSFFGFWISSIWDFPSTVDSHQYYMLKEIPMTGAPSAWVHDPKLFVGIPSILVGASIVRWGSQNIRIGSVLILVGALWLSLIASKPWHYWMDLECSRPRESALARSFRRPRPSRDGSAAIGKNHGSDAIGIGICGFLSRH